MSHQTNATKVSSAKLPDLLSEREAKFKPRLSTIAAIYHDKRTNKLGIKSGNTKPIWVAENDERFEIIESAFSLWLMHCSERRCDIRPFRYPGVAMRTCEDFHCIIGLKTEV